MTALMDKMYIKLDQRDVSYKPQIYQIIILEEVVFKVGTVVIVEETIVGIELREDRRPWRQSRSRERGMRARSESSSRSRSNLRSSTNRDRI